MSSAVNHLILTYQPQSSTMERELNKLGKKNARELNSKCLELMMRHKEALATITKDLEEPVEESLQ